MGKVIGVLVAAWLAFDPVVYADTPEAYDLLFRENTLQDLPETVAISYDRKVTNTLIKDAGERDSGRIVLSLTNDGERQAALRFEQGKKYRNLGHFPVGIGNPIIMYFLETVTRDMAESTGGSPFYIRNRIKEALVDGLELRQGEAEFGGETLATNIVEIRPFTTDPAAAQIPGFGDLILRVEMSDKVPGWYLGLRADAVDKTEPVYSSVLSLNGVEDVP